MNKPYVKERWGVRVYDPEQWAEDQKFIATESGKVICNICRRAPVFMGWGSAASTFTCRCAVDQETFERLSR